MIALAVLALLRHVLPGWFAVAAFAVIFWGALKLFNGAKFSVGWKDPKMISRALVKACAGVAIYALAWNAPVSMSAVAATFAVVFYVTAPYGEWVTAVVALWCVVTGLTKFVLLLRGPPTMPWVDPGNTYGGANFWHP
jgi:hypothetical protein